MFSDAEDERLVSWKSKKSVSLMKTLPSKVLENMTSRWTARNLLPHEIETGGMVKKLARIGKNVFSVVGEQREKPSFV